MLLELETSSRLMRNLKVPMSPAAGVRVKTPPEYWMYPGSSGCDVNTGSCLIVVEQGWGSVWGRIGLPFKNVTLFKAVYRQGCIIKNLSCLINSSSWVRFKLAEWLKKWVGTSCQEFSGEYCYLLDSWLSDIRIRIIIK